MTWQGGLGLPEETTFDAKMVETRAKYVAHRKNVAVDWTSNAAECY
jgi:hypothetical protein